MSVDVSSKQNQGSMQKSNYQQIFEQNGIENIWPIVEPLIRNSIEIDFQYLNETSISLGNSKLGGQPDLPVSIGWPKDNAGDSLSFLGQLNFSETLSHDTERLLPSSGIAYFFYDAEQGVWGYDPNDQDKFKVIYTEATESLIRSAFPEDLPQQSRFKACGLKFCSTVSLPSWENETIHGLMTDDEADTYAGINIPDKATKLLGYADPIQGEMEEECAFIANGIYCGDTNQYQHPRAKEIIRQKDQWQLLFQIDSESDSGMDWGDGGRLYFWIKKDDLKDKKFDKCWLILQCS
jgi:uncharacterized protein YwqG